ncbi:MAG: AAA family ATPase [Deltaproteobacteria bacterium]|jgi:hypothetical protein|nr:AAA family ATPase [Deltaproteobacteria bacterium]
MVFKQLPLGTYSFAKIIDDGFLYADKTKFIYELLTSSKSEYFLSRPRRFGKTLLLHTLNELFTGNRERFKGLWIDSSDYAFDKHPTLFLSLSVESDTTAILKESILTKLSFIAKAAKLEIKANTPALYLGELISALYQNCKSKVVILIDEYDAPVTKNMDNPKAAQANAKVLHDFFATLKDIYVSPCIHFTFVTGITRYTLTSTDSGPNHLNDISLDPMYEGICGFTLEDLDLYFSDNLDKTLSGLKISGEIDPAATTCDLRAKILDWYDGYSWGGENRVLNPFSVLNFVDKKKFDTYWLQSGRPAHLTSLIRARPLDFIKPKLTSYLSTDLKKSDLSTLQAIPILFHSGYLTIDKITPLSKINPETKKPEIVKSYSFRLPNYEVSSSYYSDCFSIVFNRFSSVDLEAKGQELLSAFLSKDANAVSAFFSGYFSQVSYYQNPNGENSFHGYVQLILLALGFDVRSELAESDNRLDLLVELPNRVNVILELKYCPEINKLTEDEKNAALAKVAIKRIPKFERNIKVAAAVETKLKPLDFEKAIFKGHLTTPTAEEITAILAESAIEYLTEEEINEVQANMVRKELTQSEKEKIYKDVTPTAFKPTSEEIDDALTKGAKEALKAITEKGYHRILGDRSKEIIDLGLAIYDTGFKVKAIFGS